MHADLRLQQPVSVFAVDFERHGFDARALALQPVRHHRLEALALRPAQVHAQQHLGPILAFGAARAGMNGDNGVARVVFAREQHGRLDALQKLGVGLRVALDIAADVFPFARQLEQRVQIVGERPYALVVGDGFFQPLTAAHHLLAVFGLRPEVRRGSLLFDLG